MVYYGKIILKIQKHFYYQSCPRNI